MTGYDPAAFAVTGRCSIQLSYIPKKGTEVPGVLVKNVAAQTFVVSTVATHHRVDTILSTTLKLGVRLAYHVLEARSYKRCFGSRDSVGHGVSFADARGDSQGHREPDHKDHSGTDEVVDVEFHGVSSVDLG